MPKKYVPKLLDFDKLTAAQRRIAIAKDVIIQLNAKRIMAIPGTYLTTNKEVISIEDVEKDRPLHECLAQIKTCHACAIGSLFVCAVEKFNMVGCGTDPDISDDSFQRDILSKYFSKRQLELMEGFFEVWIGGNEGSGKYSHATAKKMIPHWNKIHKSVDKDTYIIVSGNNYDDYECPLFDAEGFFDQDYFTDARLRWIMKNIIENDGTFKL